jgi:hypothetical protein
MREKASSYTQMGEKVLRKMGSNITRKRRGGSEHEYWKYRIAEQLIN